MNQKAVVTYAQLNKAIDAAWDQAKKRGINTSMLDGIEEYLSDHVGSVQIDTAPQIDEDLKDKSIEDIFDIVLTDVEENQVSTIILALKNQGLTYSEAIRYVNDYYADTTNKSPEETLSSNVEDALRDRLNQAKNRLGNLTIEQVEQVEKLGL